MKAVLTLIFLLCLQFAFAQTATIRVAHTKYPEQFKDFNNFIFSFNDLKFSGADTAAKKIRLNKKGFDECSAVLGKDTLHFFAKFKAGETYTISPGCCCAAFTITAMHDPRRGSVRFDNQTSRDLWGVTSEINTDSLKAKSKSQYIFANESAMCLFKPANIFIAETNYSNSKYDYQTNSEVNYDSLWVEQKQYVLASSAFLFLHGEKLTVEYSDKSRKLIFRFDGYLTDEEYQDR